MKAGSEHAWQQQVTNLALYYRWHYYHAPDNRPVRTRSGRTIVQNVVAGFPDLLLIRGDELIVAELKTDTGRVRPEQTKWLDLFRGCGIEAHIWRPRDLQDVILRLTRGIEHEVAA